ncbi:MAG TPA: bifunctional DNA primase/polymerase [Candidatus Obscuribacterales bacterium]
MILDHALKMLERGFAVFALSPGTKIPIAGTSGFKEATRDADIVRRWFAACPEINYGIALASTDLVLDADPRNYPAGRDVLAECLAKNFPSGGMPVRLAVATPAGGRHIYTTKPADLKVRKKQDQWPGIDFLSDGAYTVGPGSIVDGKAYEEITLG